jgi:hypothetical protein
MEIDSSSSSIYHTQQNGYDKGFGMENTRLQIDNDAYKLDAENAPVPKDLSQLCQILHRVFAQDTVNVEYVKRIIENYKSNPKDWRKYAKYDPHK